MNRSRSIVASLALSALMIAGHASVVAAQSLPAADPAPSASTASTQVYLPMVMRPVVGIANGNFESGASGWVEYSARGALPLVRTSFTGSVAAYSPIHAAWLGGEYNDTQYLQQVVTVPSGQPYLAYWHWIASADFCGYDFARIRVNGAQVASYDLCSSANTNGWVRRTFNLGAYAGQQVTLQIRVTTDSSKNSNLFIDDVAFQPTAALTADEVAAALVLAPETMAPAEKPAHDTPASVEAAPKAE